MPFDPNRRRFLLGAAAAGVAAALPPSARALAALGASARALELVAARDRTTGLRLLELPRGFSYLSFGWAGDEMHGGVPTPQRHDGMAVVAASGRRLTLIRNHELAADSGAFAGGDIVYDPAAGGGTVTLEFDGERGRLLRAYPSLAGTAVNCAGGPTPWGSWLSGEETVRGPGDLHAAERRPLLFKKAHGFMFEVSADGPHAARPLPALGRFVHEAAAVDPATGIVYLTEDRAECGFYRCVPKQPGQLERGGKLEMLAAVANDGAAARDLARGFETGPSYAVRWVPIDDPMLAHTPGTNDSMGVFAQGRALGGTRFARLEGCWAGGGMVYFTSTSGGDAGLGQVWRYDPRAERLTLVYESRDAELLERPDNITVSPRGALVVCEDKNGVPRLIAISAEGRATAFARNAVRLDGERNALSGDFTAQEFAGACFSPDGRWLFVNVQTPGISFAITGPWARLGL